MYNRNDSSLSFEMELFEQEIEEASCEALAAGFSYVHFCASEEDAQSISTGKTLRKSSLADSCGRSEYNAAYAVQVGGTLSAANHLDRCWAVLFNTSAMVSESYDWETLFPTNDAIILDDCVVIRANVAKSLLDGSAGDDIYFNDSFLMHDCANYR